MFLSYLYVRFLAIPVRILSISKGNADRHFVALMMKEGWLYTFAVVSMLALHYYPRQFLLFALQLPHFVLHVLSLGKYQKNLY